MYSSAGRVLKFGPPDVMMYIWSKTFSEAMTCSTTTRVVVRERSGIVIPLICCQGEAPSMAEDSYSSRGMSCRPARYRTKLKPRVHHTVAIAIEVIAQLGSPSHAGAVMPILSREAVASPRPGV